MSVTVPSYVLTKLAEFATLGQSFEAAITSGREAGRTQATGSDVAAASNAISAAASTAFAIASWVGEVGAPTAQEAIKSAGVMSGVALGIDVTNSIVNTAAAWYNYSQDSSDANFKKALYESGKLPLQFAYALAFGLAFGLPAAALAFTVVGQLMDWWWGKTPAAIIAATWAFNKLTLVFRDPLILDLDGDGVEVSPLLGSTTYFDYDQDGFAERTGWVAPDDGILAIDDNGNGLVDAPLNCSARRPRTGSRCSRRSTPITTARSTPPTPSSPSSGSGATSTAMASPTRASS
jgi:hypothetical protein